MSYDPSFIVLGTGGPFTFHLLSSLIQSQCLPVAYVQYASSSSAPPLEFSNIPIESNINQNPILPFLQQKEIPFFYQSALDLSAFINEYNADFILVACWPELISKAVIESVNCAALNMHPSLLPAFRGFDPIRDQIASGILPFGVSLHLLNEQFDCGDIVLQQEISVSQLKRNNIESACARAGAVLFIRAIQTFSNPGWTLVSQRD